MSSLEVDGEITAFDAVTNSNGIDFWPASNSTSIIADGGGNNSGNGQPIVIYVSPLIVLLGTIGNCLSFFVFRCTKLRQLSTSCYLTALSLSDTGCLLTYFVIWLSSETVGINVFNRPVICQVLVYLFYVCGFMSPWFVVAFTVERYVATCYPLWRNSICTVSRAQGIVLSLTVIAVLSYIYIPFLTELDEMSRCNASSDHLETLKILNILDTIATLIVPAVLIIALNVLIAKAVMQIEKVRCTMLSTTTTITTTTATTPTTMSVIRSSDDEDDDEDDDDDDDNDGGDGATKLSSPSMSAKRSTFNPTGRSHFVSDVRRKNSKGVRCCYQMKITKMLLLISTVFVVLNTPSFAARLWVYFSGSNTTTTTVHNLQQWLQMLFLLNFAINFLLYCVSGQNFRRSLKTLFWRLLGRFDKRLPRYGRGMSFSSSKRTMTVVSNSLHATTTTNAYPAASFRTIPRQLSDETTVVVVVDSV